MTNNILERVCDIISDQLVIDPKRVTYDATLESLGADSLDIFDIIGQCEEEFGIAIPDDFLPGLISVDDLVSCVREKMQGAAA